MQQSTFTFLAAVCLSPLPQEGLLHPKLWIAAQLYVLRLAAGRARGALPLSLSPVPDARKYFVSSAGFA
jgi:hypothetical protein